MCAVPSVAVCCSVLMSCFTHMLLRYCLSDFEMVTVALIITGITFVFTLHIRCISILRSLCFRIFSASFLVTFLSPQIATSINICSFFIITHYDVRFIVSDGSVGLQLLIPQYGYLTFITCFY
jgi:hypothetical protein